jgi:hypothetical protein
MVGRRRTGLNLGLDTPRSSRQLELSEVLTCFLRNRTNTTDARSSAMTFVYSNSSKKAQPTSRRRTTINDTGGRFSAVGAAHVIGSTPIPQYPAASAPFQCDPVGLEPPLSAYENPGFEPSTTPACPVEASGPASAPSFPVDVQRAGPSHSPSYRRVR